MLLIESYLLTYLMKRKICAMSTCFEKNVKTRESQVSEWFEKNTLHKKIIKLFKLEYANQF